jgi:hypothetical protein
LSIAERRRAQRLSLQCPVIVRWQDGTKVHEIRTLSENISSKGVYCFLAEWIKTGASVEVMVTLPAQITVPGTVKVHCFGRVQRCESTRGEKRGIAFAFERFEFLGLD